MESHWENRWPLWNWILPLTESFFPLLRYWMIKWSRAQEKHGIRRKWPNRRSFSDITISILEWLFVVFWLNITIFQVGKYEFSDGEAIRDTVKTQLTMCYICDIMSDHDVHCPFYPDHITFIVFHLHIKCLPLSEEDITTSMHLLPSDIYYTRITPYVVDLTAAATLLYTTITTRKSNLMNRLCSYRPQLPKNTGIKWMRLNSGTVNPKCPVTTIQS